MPSRPLATALAAAAVVAIGALAAALRLYRLSDLFPILVDESIYLRWAQIIHHQREWFVSLLDGKQPLSYWLLVAMRIAGPADLLIGGRLLSVAAGISSTLALFAVGRRLGGFALGVIAALLYSALPFALLYDRLAYTDSLVQLFSVLVAWASLTCFDAPGGSLGKAVLAGVVLAVAILVKSTSLQFAAFPILIALTAPSLRPRSRIGRLAVICGIAALPLALSPLLRPTGPRFAEVNPFLHRTDLFAPAGVGENLRFNARLISGYLAAYVTVPLCLASIAGILWLIRRRSLPVLAVVASGLVPLLLQVAFLRYFPSRYVFPHVWILLVAAAFAVVASGRAGYLLALLLAAPVAFRDWTLLTQPSFALHRRDAVEFLGSGPYSGFGVREAIGFLLRQAEQGPFALLTDPFYGPPADAMFAYLDRRNGIAVYDAWWLQVPDYPLLPAGPIPVMKSQYQRVNAGAVDFSSLPRVYYVTDTNYHVPADIQARQPGARLLVRFAKPDGLNSIDVYRLR